VCRFNVAGTKQLFLLSFTIPVTLWVVSCSCLAMSSKVKLKPEPGPDPQRAASFLFS
jgi:hypothetical protein